MNVILVGASTLAGGAVGYLVGKYMARSGFGCPLLCNPKISTIYFALVGLILALK